MGDVYTRESRYREYVDPPSEDEGYKRTTVRRYKVKPSREDHFENVEVDDDYRSHYSKRSNYPEYERRPERPRSAFETTFDDRQRTAFYERDVIERDFANQREADRGKITVYEGDKSDLDDRRSRYSRRDDDVRVERRVEYSHDDHDHHDVDHYRKETEYFSRASPPPPPVVIRERPREPQKIIVEEAPVPAPVIISRREERDRDVGAMVIRDKERDRDREVVRREPRDDDRDFYSYRHERYGDVGPHRGEAERDREYAMARYDRFHRDRSRSDDEDYYVRRRVVRRERSESPHHKRQLAAGALAGAGLTALMNSRRGDHGDLPDHRGRKVVAGGALGALGTEAIRRAHSAYGDRFGDRDESPEHHSKLKKGLGIAAVALAAAGAAKYYQSNKIDKEEASRGRSRRRGRSYSGSSYSGSRSRSVKSKSRKRSMSTAAKAALGTAATAGIVQHFRDKSKGRSGSRSRSRSKSRIRRAAEIGGAAAAAGVATKLWKNHKEKKEDEERSRSRARSDVDSDYDRRGGASLSRSRSRSRSQARSLRRTDPGTDPELGLVEYGNDPLGPNPPRSYESEAEERRRRRQRRRERSVSSDGSAGSRKRSKSRLRNMAAAGAAAFGIKEYKDRKDAEKKEQEDRQRRERRERDLDRRERDADRRDDRSRNRSKRRKYFGLGTVAHLLTLIQVVGTMTLTLTATLTTVHDEQAHRPSRLVAPTTPLIHRHQGLLRHKVKQLPTLTSPINPTTTNRTSLRTTQGTLLLQLPALHHQPALPPGTQHLLPDLRPRPLREATTHQIM